MQHSVVHCTQLHMFTRTEFILHCFFHGKARQGKAYRNFEEILPFVNEVIKCYLYEWCFFPNLNSLCDGMCMQSQKFWWPNNTKRQALFVYSAANTIFYWRMRAIEKESVKIRKKTTCKENCEANSMSNRNALTALSRSIFPVLSLNIFKKIVFLTYS